MANATLPRLVAAMNYAADQHRHQRRKGESALPYINHPIALANTLANEAGITDAQVLIAAVLHDVVEDCAKDAAERRQRAREIRKLFGPQVLEIVLEVTDDKDLEKAERKRMQVVHAATISRRAKLVKVADKINNLRDIARDPPPSWDLARRQAYFDWAQAVVDAMGKPHAKLDALFRKALKARPAST